MTKKHLHGHFHHSKTQSDNSYLSDSVHVKGDSK